MIKILKNAQCKTDKVTGMSGKLRNFRDKVELQRLQGKLINPRDEVKIKQIKRILRTPTAKNIKQLSKTK